MDVVLDSKSSFQSLIREAIRGLEQGLEVFFIRFINFMYETTLIMGYYLS